MLDSYSYRNPDLLYARDKVNNLDRSLDNFYRLEENGLFLVDPFSSSTLFYVSCLFDEYIEACRCLMKIQPYADKFRESIVDYLTFQNTCRKFDSLSDYLLNLMTTIKESTQENEVKFISDGNIEFIKRLNVDNLGGTTIPLEEQVQLTGVLEKAFGEFISQTIELFDRVQRRMNLRLTFMQGDQQKDYVISCFKNFVMREADNYLLKLRTSAFKLKNNRMVRLGKQHWANLEELDEQLISRIIDELPVEEHDYACFYDDEEWKTLVENRKVLKMLRDTSDPENLYDWSMLFKKDRLFDAFVNESNVMFLFSRVHRANLIRCELYSGMRMRYDLFLFGKITSGKSDGFDSPVIHADSIPEDEESTLSTPQQNASSSPATRQTASPFIHPRIDEEKLVNFTKDFTDGPNRASCFNKNCLWLSVYIVFCQKHPKLGNRSILLSKSRAKFEEWVQTRISPSVYRCFKRSLDTAPPYFRKMQNYPWSLAAYLKAKGQKESTFNSYAQVAEYFQKCVFDNIEDFMID